MINNFYGDISSLSVTILKPDNDALKSTFDILSEEEIDHSGFDHPNAFLTHSIHENDKKEKDYPSNSISSSLIVNNNYLKSLIVDEINDIQTGHVPPILPLIKVKYSLDNDMLFGWVPKITHGAPIPLSFSDKFLDILLDHIQDRYKSPTIDYSKHEIIYHGLRYRDTFRLHELYSGDNTYPFKLANILFLKYQNLSKYMKDEDIDNRCFIGMNPILAAHEEALNFDSSFESGNLDTVIKVKYHNFFSISCIIQLKDWKK